MRAIKHAARIPRPSAEGHIVAGARNFFAACAVSIGAWASTTTVCDADELTLPAGARVGIIVMMYADLTHFHVGKSRLASFMRTYPIGWPVSEVVDEPIAVALKGMGFEPVSLDPTEQLWRQRQAWIISNPRANELPKGAEEEIGRILETENLQGLVIVAPGPNTNPESVQGNRLRKLPTYVQGWGFSTSDESDGITTPVVFNLTQMLLIGRSGESPELTFREWGGAFVYEWPGFEPGTDLKALPAEVIVKFRPVMQDILQKQIERLTPLIKVAEQ
jgi:hypothetical protein